MSFRAFIEQNRRAGTTTQLAHAAIAADGYLIVEQMSNVHCILRAFPELEGRVFTVGQIKRGRYPAEKRPLFFDLPVTLERAASV